MRGIPAASSSYGAIPAQGTCNGADVAGVKGADDVYSVVEWCNYRWNRYVDGAIPS